MPLRDDILNPIEGPSPAGPNLRYDPVYDRIKDARTETDVPVIEGDPWQGERKTADWGLVVKLCSEVLATRSKDLQVAAWLTEGLLQKDGFGGLRQGLVLLRELQEQFWEGLHPEIEDGDQDFRVGPLEWVGGYLDTPVRLSPLTRSGLALLKYQESRAVGYEDDPDEDKRDGRRKAVSEGKITAEEWDEAFNATPKEWYRTAVKELDGCLEAAAALEAFTDERYDPEIRPSFKKLRDALGEVRRVAGQLFARKLELDPDPVEVEAMAPLDAGADEEDVSGAGGGEAGGEDATLSAEPRNRKDAAARIATVARFLRKEDPRDPTPYILSRGLAWGALRAAGPEVDPKQLEAPPTALRTRIRALILDGKWPQVLETTEEIMVSNYGRGWLDVQRYALDACANLGSEYERVADVIRGALKDLLRDLPQFPELTLMDDSPTANGETRAWLRSEGLLRSSRGEDDDLPAPRRGERDVFALAQDRVRSGQPQKAVELLMREAAQEKSPRARFLRRAQAAEIMLDHGLAVVARPILREMLDQIEEHKLENWESGETIARPMGLLYRTLELLGDDERIKEDLYLRVCRLDPMQAISFGMTGGAE
jgi:type VI secretion system protein ImpA